MPNVALRFVSVSLWWSGVPARDKPNETVLLALAVEDNAALETSIRTAGEFIRAHGTNACQCLQSPAAILPTGGP